MPNLPVTPSSAPSDILEGFSKEHGRRIPNAPRALSQFLAPPSAQSATKRPDSQSRQYRLALDSVLRHMKEYQNQETTVVKMKKTKETGYQRKLLDKLNEGKGALVILLRQYDQYLDFALSESNNMTAVAENKKPWVPVLEMTRDIREVLTFYDRKVKSISEQVPNLVADLNKQVIEGDSPSHTLDELLAARVGADALQKGWKQEFMPQSTEDLALSTMLYDSKPPLVIPDDLLAPGPKFGHQLSRMIYDLRKTSLGFMWETIPDISRPWKGGIEEYGDVEQFLERRMLTDNDTSCGLSNASSWVDQSENASGRTSSVGAESHKSGDVVVLTSSKL
ncbi:hypothetical protein BJ508DRAFT_44989 [Ascobolus immersus RN42]|uniref:Uncharacterized protein n=1 Tax=Ascobolus immersus RN42 TaxID=1160509 RepID=A0A3N4HVZ6_ASCIM|nr:hypothetical protein BJ508DRAFT_44989 [Ascobolus immersus RN42]